MLLSQLACNREKNKSKLDLGPLGGKRVRNVDLRMWSKESANHSTETENIRSCLACISLTKYMVERKMKGAPIISCLKCRQLSVWGQDCMAEEPALKVRRELQCGSSSLGILSDKQSGELRCPKDC